MFFVEVLRVVSNHHQLLGAQKSHHQEDDIIKVAVVVGLNFSSRSKITDALLKQLLQLIIVNCQFSAYL